MPKFILLGSLGYVIRAKKWSRLAALSQLLQTCQKLNGLETESFFLKGGVNRTVSLFRPQSGVLTRALVVGILWRKNCVVGP